MTAVGWLLGVVAGYAAAAVGGLAAAAAAAQGPDHPDLPALTLYRRTNPWVRARSWEVRVAAVARRRGHARRHAPPILA
jgi:hypothetical protein